MNLFGSLFPDWIVPPVGVIRNAPLGYRDDFYWTNTTGRTVTVTYLIQLYGTESDYCYCSIYVGPGTDYSQPVVFNECGNRYYNCLLYTSDAADEEDSVDLGGRRMLKKKKKKRDEVWCM